MLRIVSEDGIGHGVKILDSKTGQNLAEVLAVGYGGTITIGQEITAQLPLAILHVDTKLTSAEWVTKHPISEKLAPLAAMEFRDGTRVEFPQSGLPVVSNTNGG
jgi:hypothetical protein